MLYMLPTRATRNYRGKHPDRIYSISLSGMDRDCAKAAHHETNRGERYTISYDLLDMARVNKTRTFVGTSFTEFLKGRVPIHAITAEEYSDWLRVIHARRAGITVDLTGSDWEPTPATKFYAQRGAEFAFGPTPLAALEKLA